VIFESAIDVGGEANFKVFNFMFVSDEIHTSGDNILEVIFFILSSCVMCDGTT